MDFKKVIGGVPTSPVPNSDSFYSPLLKAKSQINKCLLDVGTVFTRSRSESFSFIRSRSSSGSNSSLGNVFLGDASDLSVKSLLCSGVRDLKRLIEGYSVEIEKDPHLVSIQDVRLWLDRYEEACAEEDCLHKFYGLPSVPSSIQIALIRSIPRESLCSVFPEMAENYNKWIPENGRSGSCLHERFRQDFARSIEGMHFFVSDNAPKSVELGVSGISSAWKLVVPRLVLAERISEFLLSPDVESLNSSHVFSVCEACDKICKGRLEEFPYARQLESIERNDLLGDENFRRQLLTEVQNEMKKAIEEGSMLIGGRVSYQDKINSYVSSFNKCRKALGLPLLDLGVDISARKKAQKDFLMARGFDSRSESPVSVLDGGSLKNDLEPLTYAEELAYEIFNFIGEFVPREEQFQVFQTIQVTVFAPCLEKILGVLSKPGDLTPIHVKQDPEVPIKFELKHIGESPHDDLFIEASCSLRAKNLETGVVTNYETTVLFEVKSQLASFSLKEIEK